MPTNSSVAFQTGQMISKLFSTRLTELQRMARRHRFAFSSFMVLVFTLVNVGGLLADVICVHPNGAIGLESTADTGACCGKNGSSDVPHSRQQAIRANATCCQDIAIPRAAVIKQEEHRAGELLPPAIIWSFVAYFVLPETIPPSSLPNLFTLLRPSVSAPEFLRTVVLLI